MATDADKFGKNDGLIFFLAQFVWSVLSLPVVMCLLAQLVGYAAVGVVVLLIVGGSFINKFLMSLTKPVVHKLQAM